MRRGRNHGGALLRRGPSSGRRRESWCGTRLL